MTTKTQSFLLATFLFLGLSGLTWWLYRRFLRDGLGPTGQWDDEGGISDTRQPVEIELTYAQNPIQMRHFEIEEFDSPDLANSGGQMKIKFLQMIDECRERAGIAFQVNSGYRTRSQNESVGGVSDSAHTRGRAADISAGNMDKKIRIVRAARSVGFNRFGIYDTFIHLDCDPAKSPNVAWNKKLNAVQKGGDFAKFPFDPFKV